MMTGLRHEQTGIFGNDTRVRQKLPEIVTLPQLCKDAGWQAHAFGKLFHLGGGKDVEQKALWIEVGRSWHTAKAFGAMTKKNSSIMQTSPKSYTMSRNSSQRS